MRAREFINEDRSELQAKYMQGQCMILAIAINQYNPQRYPVGYIWEYSVEGVPDIQLDADEWEDLSPEEQQEVADNPERRSLTHAFVYDQVTKEYIDARGRHKELPNLWGNGVTRFEKFPGTAKDLINITSNGEWDEGTEVVRFTRGQSAFDTLAGPGGIKKALDYAIKHLGVVRPEQVRQQPTPPATQSNTIEPSSRVSAVRDQRKIINWLRQESGVLMIGFDDANLKYEGVTIVQGALTNPKITMQDLLSAVNQTKLDTPQNENFADGKHPGRKGLAKRSGVNTKASVSSLRKTAKHSSGEKQRMAHWLANMKAGRAKANKK